MGSTAANPTATFANSLGYDVDIYDVFNTNSNTGTPGPLTYTKLATIPKGASAQQVATIHYASQLQAMRTGNITALNNNFYEQFPVAVLPVSPFADSNEFTLTSDMQQSMEDSFKFIKYTSANPASQLATNFRTALGDKTSQNNAVNQYFQNTASFKKCTLTTWMAVFSWQAQFTNPWQGTYYLYSLGSSSTGSTTDSSAPALVATLAIVASIKADSAVLTMAGTNNETTSVVMGGDGTMQEKDQGTGNLSVVLNPTWLNITQTSQQNGKTVSSYAIGAAFTGTINGQKVAGNLNQLAIPDPKDNSNNAKNKNGANSFSLNSMAQVVGMLTGIGMLYYMAKGHKQAETQKKNEVQEGAEDRHDAEEREDDVDRAYQEDDVPVQREEAARLDRDVVPEVAPAARQMSQAAEIQIKQSTVNEQINELTEVLEGGAPSAATEDAAVNLGQARTNLDKAIDPNTSPAERDVALEDVTTTLTNVRNELEKELEMEGNHLSEEEKKTFEDVQEALDQEKEQADAAKENEKEQEEKIKEDQDNDVDPADLNDPKEQDPAEYVGPVEV